MSMAFVDICLILVLLSILVFMKGSIHSRDVSASAVVGTTIGIVGSTRQALWCALEKWWQ